MKVEEFNLEALRLIEEGYVQRAPGKAAEIDGPIANTTRCEECGFVGGYYRPFYLAERNSYLAYAICGGCENVVEF